jgi:hypothetical protein
LANLVRLGLAATAGLKVEDLGDTVATEDVVTSATLTLGEAEAAKEGAEVVKPERPGRRCRSKGERGVWRIESRRELMPATRSVASYALVELRGDLIIASVASVRRPLASSNVR